MGLTITNREYTVFGTKRVVFCDIAFDDSYPTGGESLTASDVRLSDAHFVTITSKSSYIFEYDYTNSLVLAYDAGAGTEVGSGTNLSAVTSVKVMMIGR